MGHGHGGRRPGAGRKPRAERFAAPIAAAEQRISDRLPAIIENLFHLADGGYQRVTETLRPAGLVFVEDEVRGKRPAFPDLPPDQLVVIERRRETADRDRAANVYLVDRVLGRPTQAVEAELAGPDGMPLALTMLAALDAEDLTRRLEDARRDLAARGVPAES